MSPLETPSKKAKKGADRAMRIPTMHPTVVQFGAARGTSAAQAALAAIQQCIQQNQLQDMSVGTHRDITSVSFHLGKGDDYDQKRANILNLLKQISGMTEEPGDKDFPLRFNHQGQQARVTASALATLERPAINWSKAFKRLNDPKNKKP